MSCNVGKATQGFQYELWRRWSDGKFREWALLVFNTYFWLSIFTFHGRLARWCKWKACDVREAKEGLENDLWRRWSNGRVGEWAVTLVKRWKGFRMSCDVDEVTKRLENELCWYWTPIFDYLYSHLHFCLFRLVKKVSNIIYSNLNELLLTYKVNEVLLNRI